MEFLLTLLAAWLLLSPLLALVLIHRLNRRVQQLESELERARRGRGQPAATDDRWAKLAVPPPLGAAPLGVSKTSGSSEPRQAVPISPTGHRARTEPDLEPAWRADAGAAADAPVPPESGAPAHPPAALPGRPWLPEVSRAQGQAAAPKTGGEARGLGIERWLGVRGAALLGGSLLALSTILLFKHAFDRGWIQPPLRIAMGYAAGGLALLASARTQRGRFLALPGALAGAGLVALYASTWAAHRLYGYLSELGALPLFIAITVLGGWLAVRRKSQSTALIGLFGGFATPLLLEVEQPSAWAFFGYLLFLDAGVLWVAVAGRFTLLPSLAVLAAALVEALWMWRFLSGANLPVVLLALGLQALLFSAVGRTREVRHWGGLKHARLGALVMTAVAALALAGQQRWQEFSPGHGLLFATLLGGALWVERDLGLRYLGLAFGVLAMVVPALAWGAGGEPPTTALDGRGLALMWWFPLLVVAAARAWSSRRAAQPVESSTWNASLAGISAAGVASLLLAALVTPGPGPLWLLLPTATALGLLWSTPPIQLDRVVGLKGHAIRQGAVGLATGLAALAFANTPGLRRPEGPWPLWVFGGLALILCLDAARARAGATQHDTEAQRRAGATSLAVAGWAAMLPGQLQTVQWVAGLGAFAIVLAFVLATRSRSTLAPWGTLLVTLYLPHRWAALAETQGQEPRTLLLALGGGLLGTLAALRWSAEAGKVAGENGPGNRSAARLAPAALFVLTSLPALDYLWNSYRRPSEDLLTSLLSSAGPAGSTAVLGALALAFALAPSAGAASLAGRRALWSLGLGLLAVCLGRVLDGPSANISLAAALVAFGVLAARPPLWPQQAAGAAEQSGPRSAHSGSLLPWVACSVLGAVALAPALIDLVFQGYPAPLGRPGLSLRGVAYAVSALATARAAQRAQQALGKTLPGLPLTLYGLALGFGLATFSVLALEAFLEPGHRVQLLGTQELGAQTALSISWGLYALGLLLAGQRGRLDRLRWASLAVLCLALGKLFLFDLSDLDGLYRVASIAGLALSLFAVSWIYQRLVFKAEPRAGD